MFLHNRHHNMAKKQENLEGERKMSLSSLKVKLTVDNEKSQRVENFVQLSTEKHVLLEQEEVAYTQLVTDKGVYLLGLVDKKEDTLNSNIELAAEFTEFLEQEIIASVEVMRKAGTYENAPNINKVLTKYVEQLPTEYVYFILTVENNNILWESNEPILVHFKQPKGKSVLTSCTKVYLINGNTLAFQPSEHLMRALPHNEDIYIQLKEDHQLNILVPAILRTFIKSHIAQKGCIELAELLKQVETYGTTYTVTKDIKSYAESRLIEAFVDNKTKNEVTEGAGK